MISYNKKIVLGKYPSGDWYLQSDRGDRYETFAITNTRTPWTTWWDMQDQSELRIWQKEIARMFASKITDLSPMVIYKKNHGYNQAHDLILCHSGNTDIWMLGTNEDFWIQQNSYGHIDFDCHDSLGSVLEKDIRNEIFKVYDGL